jgi:hypothetical protein
MPCAFCGEGDKWIKTCRTLDSLIRVCDPCWEVLTPWLVIVPGDRVVTARCEGCGGYFNPRDMVQVTPGGRYNAYAGRCGACAKVGTACRSEVPTLFTQDLEFTPGTPGKPTCEHEHQGYRGQKWRNDSPPPGVPGVKQGRAAPHPPFLRRACA